MKKGFLSKKLLWIVIGLPVCILAICIGCLYWGKARFEADDELTYLAQTGPQKGALQTDYLMSLLDFPLDHPLPFDSINLEEAKRRLSLSPLIKRVELKKEKGGMLLIDYTVRHPDAFFGDFSNLALDREGHFFPFFPFFTPKKITSFYFGLSALPKSPLKGEKIDLAFAVLDTLSEVFPSSFPFPICIDVSHAFESSLGKREIVVTLKTRSGDRHYLRLMPEHYLSQISRYAVICETWEGDLTFDCRLSQLAFVK